jgi:hypothetical protein
MISYNAWKLYGHGNDNFYWTRLIIKLRSELLIGHNLDWSTLVLGSKIPANGEVCSRVDFCFYQNLEPY